MRIALLGSLQVDDGRTALSPRDRVVLLALASRPGAELSTDTLAETLWGEHVPDSAHKVVQGCISRLRKTLGPETVETTAHGYRLTLHRDEMDHAQFEHLLGRARQLLAGGEPERALFVIGQARELWRGEPFTELADWAPGRVESERLLELCRDAEDLHAEAALRTGHHRDVLADVRRLVAEEPTRERRWGLLALAQYQDGRQGDALQTLHRAKQTLVNELGLDPGPELSELEQAILRQDPGLAASAEALSPSSVECPYLGLIAYDVSDAPAFFGRESDVSACLRRLGETGVVAILGPSGCGKSSLARAGVGAALERGGRRVQVMTPGTTPNDALVALRLRPEDALVVDQCEEALALPADSPQRTAFVDSVVAFAETRRGQLVVSMRADRLGELSSHPDLARVVESGLYLLGPMAEDDLRRAIEGPAAQAGLRLEPGLTNLLMHEVAGEPAALPLLSHVLRQTWRHREGATLTVEGYAATGGVREAVSQSAEGLFRGLAPHAQDMVRELMLRLVSPDEGGEPVRTRVPRRAVTGDAAHAQLVEQLVAARLLASDGDSIEIAHESLAVAWPRLRSWLDEDVDGLRIMRHLAVAADSWDEIGRPDSELYRGVREARAREWQARTTPTLTAEEDAFLTASADLADKEQQATEEQVRRERRLNQRLRLGLAATAGLLAVAIVLGTIAKTNGDRADTQAAAAAARARTADAQRLGAEAMRTDDHDRALLLAAAGVTLDNSLETRNYLLDTLGRVPSLLASSRVSRLTFGLAVNPTTGVVATSNVGSDLRLLDGKTLAPVAQPSTGTRSVGLVASPDGTRFAAVGWTNLVQDGQLPAVVLLDADGSRSATQLGGIPKGFHTFQELNFSPNGRWLSATLRPFNQKQEATRTLVWNLASPAKPLASLSLDDDGSPVVSPDGRSLWSKGRDGIQLTDLPSGSVRRTIPTTDLGVRGLGDSMALSPDGTWLALPAGDEVVLLDTATLKPKHYLPGLGWATGVAFSPDGTRLAASGDRLIAWDISGSEPAELLVQDGFSEYPRFSPDGTTVYSSNRGLLEAWDVTGTRRFIPDSTGRDTGFQEGASRWTPDLTKVGYGTFGPAFRVRDVATGRLTETVTVEMEQRNMLDFAWHPDGTLLNVTSGDPVVRIWDGASGKEVARQPLGGATEGAVFAWFTPDGRSLLVGTTTGRLHILDARTLKPLRAAIQVYEPVDGKPRELSGFMPNADGSEVYTGDRIIDTVSGTVRTYPELGAEFDDVFPSPDGTRLFVDAQEAGTGLLDLTSMTWSSPPDPSQARMVGWQSTFSDDGSLFSSIGDNGDANVWDARTGALIASMPMHATGAPAFTKDKKRLLVADASGSVLTWDLDPARWRAAACRLAGRDVTQEEWRTYLPNRPFTSVCSP